MDLRSEILRVLTTPQADTRFGDGYSYLVRDVKGRVGCRDHEVWQELWAMVADGLIYLNPAGQGSGTVNWRWLPSALGIQVATGGRWEPRDPEGYLRRLRKQSPALDPAALDYVEEALHAFNARCYLATSVMLGVASERVVDLLAQAVVVAHGARAKKLSEVVSNRRSNQSARFDALQKVLDPMRAELPDGLYDSLTMNGVAELLRITRNDAGHATGVAVEEETAYAHLQLAATYLTKMTALTAHMVDGASVE